MNGSLIREMFLGIRVQFVEGDADCGTRVTITPAFAKKLLETCNSGNRVPRRRQVEYLAKQMTDRRWRYNRERLLFSRKKILNGQHRLMACVKSGVAFETDIVVDMDETTFATLDRGAPRTARDIFHENGVADASTASGATATLCRIRDKFGTRFVRQGPEELAEIFDATPELWDAITFATKCGIKGAKIMPLALAACLIMLFREKDKARADAFFCALATGAELAEGSPILALRSTLLGHKGRGRLKERDVYVMCVKAWNDEVRGLSRKLMKRPRREEGTGPAIDSVPEIEAVVAEAVMA